jgi:hypothetical protein
MTEEELMHVALSDLLGDHHQEAEAATPEAYREAPFQILPPVSACRRVLYTTKNQWLMSLTDGTHRVPKDVAVVSHYGPVHARHRPLLQGILHALGGPVHFAGDLDPIDLVAYATLLLPKPIAPTLEYAGISDRWIERCEADLAKSRKLLERLFIPMDPAEHAGIERMKRLPIDWNRVVGARGMTLLETGLKLELEGASNPALYSAGFRDQSIQFLFGE